MRLLSHPADYYWYQCDEESYDAETERMNQELEAQWANHMKQFPEKPKLTKAELEERIDYRKSRVEATKRMEMPEEIIENEKHLLDEVVTIYGNKDWLYKSEDKIYRAAYDKQRDSFEFIFTPNIPDKVKDFIESKGEKDYYHFAQQ